VSEVSAASGETLHRSPRQEALDHAS
jgi:hypothetical protein